MGHRLAGLATPHVIDHAATPRMPGGGMQRQREQRQRERRGHADNQEIPDPVRVEYID